MQCTPFILQKQYGFTCCDAACRKPVTIAVKGCGFFPHCSLGSNDRHDKLPLRLNPRMGREKEVRIAILSTSRWTILTVSDFHVEGTLLTAATEHSSGAEVGKTYRLFS